MILIRESGLWGAKFACALVLVLSRAWNNQTWRKPMKAIVRYKYGSPDVLELGNIDKPEIGEEEVLVRVRAAGVDRGVWHVMTGLPYAIRLAGYGPRHRRRRDRWTMARRHRSPDPRAPVVPVRGPEAGHVHREGEPRGYDRPGGAHRIRQAHTGYRQDVPARRGPRGHPLSRRRSRPRESRHHRLIPRPGNTLGGSPSPKDRYGRQARRAASAAYYLLAFRIRLGA